MNWDVLSVPAATIVVAVIGVWGQRVAGKSAKQQKAMVSEIKEWANQCLATEVETWKEKYWRSAQHIRELRVGHPEPRPSVPLIIREDV